MKRANRVLAVMIIAAALISALPFVSAKDVGGDGVSLFITEVSNYHTKTYFSDYFTGSYVKNTGVAIQKFQYIELYNYSDTTVDLSEYTFVYNDGKDHAFEWILEQDGSLMLESGEMYVIGVYSAQSAAKYYPEYNLVNDKAYTYDTEAGKKAYWTDFCEFYNVDIPVSNRVMIACVKSGTKTTLDGIAKLRTSKEAGVTVTAEMRKGDQTVVKASLPNDLTKPAYDSYAYHFVPDATGGEKLLFGAGCFPYDLLCEQDPEYDAPALRQTEDALSVMSYNILATEKDDEDNRSGLYLSERAVLLDRTIKSYDADIVGLQEVNYMWIPHLKVNMAAQGYACVEGISMKGNTYETNSTVDEWDLMNPIYYKKDKFELINSGYSYLTRDGADGAQWDKAFAEWGYTKWETICWDTKTSKRVVTWVALRNKQSGEVTVVLNSHIVLAGRAARVYQLSLMAQLGRSLQKKYGGGVVITGDHNMRENSEPYQVYIDAGYLDTKYQTTNHNSLLTCPNYARYNESFGSAIDYCFVSDNYTVGQYKVVNGAYADGTVSDHSAIYVELYRDNSAPVISGVSDGKNYCEQTTFSVSDDSGYYSVLVNGSEVTMSNGSYTLTKAGSYTIKATDAAGRVTKVSIVITTLNGHTYDNACDSICNVCFASRIAPHSYDNSCDTDCNHCPKVRTIQHTPSAWQTLQTASYLKDGLEKQWCTVCGKELSSRVTPILQGVDVDRIFTDVKTTDWFYKNYSIYYVYNAGLFKGMTETEFKPATAMNRGMFVTVLGRLHGVNADNIAYKNTFSDVADGKYYSRYVIWAADNGIVTGTSATTFAPSKNVTREQICAMMVRYCNYAGIALKAENAAINFSDAGSISNYAKTAVTTCQRAGLVSGKGDNKFDPKGNAKRSEVATILLNFAKNYL